MDKNQEQELSYKIQFSNSVCLVSFSGFLIKKNVKVLGEVSREVLEKDGIKFCIFDYSKLQEIGKYIDRDLVQFQVNLRSKEIEARHCGLPGARADARLTPPIVQRPPGNAAQPSKPANNPTSQTSPPSKPTHPTLRGIQS